jgi:hypothetical protein
MYKFVLVYQEHLMKVVILRPFETKRTEKLHVSFRMHSCSSGHNVFYSMCYKVVENWKAVTRVENYA